MKYRPDIDGVRAIAVLSVLVYHLRGSALPGGYAGVDIFFVISGYLITKNLVHEIEGPGLSIVEFYHRRMRRIAPALLVVLVASLVAGYFFLLPGDYARMSESAIYSAFGLANFFFYANTGYFDPEADMQPMLHMWSLGVEEQFYLVWPLLLAAFFWFARGRRPAVAIFISCVIAISLSIWTYKSATMPNYAFYQPQARAWELATGALLVFLQPIGSRMISEALGAVGFFLVGCGILMTDWPIPGANVVPAVIGSALLLLPQERSVAAWFLASPPMRMIGLISYSLYLWHWSLIVFFRQYANGSNPTVNQTLWIAAISFALAILSWRFVETPMRRPWKSPIKAIGVGLSAAAVIAAAGLVVDQTGGFRGRLQGDAANMSSLDQMWEWDCPNMKLVDELGGSFCTFGAPWESAEVKGVLWGDSHAGHMAPILEAAAEGESVSFLLLYQACSPIVGGPIRRNAPDNPNYTANCERLQANAMRWLQADPRIRIVVLASAWAALANLISQDGSLPKEFDDGNLLVSFGLTNLLREAASPGRSFILIGQVPNVGLDPVPCVVSESIGMIRRGCGDLGKRSAILYKLHQAEMTRLIENVAAEHPLDARAVLPGDALCQDDRCLVSLNGQFLYRDYSHLRRNLTMETRKAYASLSGLTDVLRTVMNSSVNTADRRP